MAEPEAKDELAKLSGFLREALDYPDVPVARMDILGIVQSMAMRPVTDGDFPDIECLDAILTRISGDSERLEKLKRTPCEPLVSLLPLLSQIITAYKDWADSKQQAS